ncbi:hypothetical protein L218DRAFT_846099, partial [Marasmius fiardii PR-910]
ADPKILEAAMEDQYMELILSPCAQSDQNGKDLIIIDGLDECGDPRTQQHILSIISSTYQHSLKPPPLQFLICSRPEAWLQETFKSPPLCNLTKTIKLNDAFKANHDIELYLVQEFKAICDNPRYEQVDFPKPWPAPNIIQLLVEKADGQFIYATTIMLFI